MAGLPNRGIYVEVHPLQLYHGLCECSREFANHLSDDAEQRQNNGGIGPCPSAPAAVKHKFYQRAVSKTRENTVAIVSATARAALRARAAAAATTAADAANGGEKNRGHRHRLGALEKAFQKSTAEKADDAFATLFFAELSIAPHIMES